MAIKTDILTDDTGSKSINVIDLIGSSIETICLFDVIGGVPTIVNSVGIASITDLGVGIFRVNFINPNPSKNYLVIQDCDSSGAPNAADSVHIGHLNKTANGFEIHSWSWTGAGIDNISYSVVTLGSV